MLKLFQNARTARLVNALRNGDLDSLAKLSGKYDAQTLRETLDGEMNAIELALQAGQPKALEWVLRQCPDADAAPARDEPYTLLALRQPSQSLALLSVLLQAGADPNHCHQGRALLHWCFELCEPTQLMLHLSRLVQHGASLADEGQLLHLALTSRQQPLVHFLIHSGAPLPAGLESADYDPELVGYAQRCAEDRRIRQLMLGR